jgi:LysR family hca operon transcriptional activator
MIRSARGIELTAAGRVFLDHARLALAQADAAGEAARRAAQRAKPSLALGFLTGHEIDWLPGAIRLLRDELPNVEITISSQYSPDLAGALVRGKLDVTSLRPETPATNLVFKPVTKEPLVVVLPSDHRLASHEAINTQDIAGETFISVSNTAPVLRVVIGDYLRRSGLDIKPDHEVDHLAMTVSLVASTRGVAPLPSPSTITVRGRRQHSEARAAPSQATRPAVSAASFMVSFYASAANAPNSNVSR